MAEQPPERPEANPPRTDDQADELPRIDRYANTVQVHAGIYDFKLDFALQDPKSRARVHTSIRVSPQHAKALHLLLGRFLHNYEHSIGEIPLPKELIHRLTTGERQSTHDPAS